MEEIDEHIAEYFSKEENLHRLREKLFNLEGYRLQSDINEEIADVYREKEQAIEDLKKKHKKAMEEMAEEYRLKIQQTEETYEAKLRQKNSELADYRSSVEQELRKATENKAELARWHADYSDIAKAFSNFSALSQKNQDAIAGIFGGCDTPMDFLCGSIQKGHLEQLWDYVSAELHASDLGEQEADLLSVLFDFSFDAVNRSQREPLFRRLTAPQGAAFDGDTMGRTADSPQLGRVKQMIFAGFAHEVTGSVVRRSLVKLEW